MNKKQIVKLNEAQLKQIVMESVKEVSKQYSNLDSAELNPELRKQTKTLQGMINRGPEVERFDVEDYGNYSIVTDTKTGKSTKVWLYALSQVMNALKELFE